MGLRFEMAAKNTSQTRNFIDYAARSSSEAWQHDPPAALLHPLRESSIDRHLAAQPAAAQPADGILKHVELGVARFSGRAEHFLRRRRVQVEALAH